MYKRQDKDSLKYCITPEKVREAGYMSFSAAEMDFPTAPSIIKSVTEMVQRLSLIHIYSMKKKLISMILAASMSASLLAGCSTRCV